MQDVGRLSGGNQQKVAIARWLTVPPKVLVVSEPTRGMDVGAKNDVLSILRELGDKGLGVLVVSSEPETVLAICGSRAGHVAGRDRRRGQTRIWTKDPDAAGIDMTVDDTTRITGGLLSAVTNNLATIAPVLTLVVLFVFFGSVVDSFLTQANMNNLLVQMSTIGILAAGLTFVLLTAQIDLSVAAIMALSGMIAAPAVAGPRRSRAVSDSRRPRHRDHDRFHVRARSASALAFRLS